MPVSLPGAVGVRMGVGVAVLLWVGARHVDLTVAVEPALAEIVEML